MNSRSLKLGIALAAAGLCLQPLTASAAKGDWLVRAGVGVVDPKSDNLEIAGVGTVEVDNGASLTIEGVYFFTDNWAAEVLAAYPFTHDVTLDGADVAEATHLPPTVSVQYHFIPDGKIRPYVGLGLNYTTLFSEDTEGGLAGADLKLDDSWGLAVQAGADWMLGKNWFVNAVVRYIDIDSDATITIPPSTVLTGTVEIDPIVYQLQAGYRFGGK